MKIKLTKKVVAELICTKVHGRMFYRDTDCRGLCVEVRATGGRTYYYSYRDVRGKQRNHKIANAEDITPTQARELCQRLRTKIVMGIDLAKEKKLARMAPTVTEFFNESYLPYVKTYKRSWDCDASLCKLYVLPVIGLKYIDDVDNADILDMILRAEKRLAPSTINRLIVFSRYMFNLAIRWKTCGITHNPTMGIDYRKITSYRERFLSAAETTQLIDAINCSRNHIL